LAENKIPVLTEVYKPKVSEKTNQPKGTALEVTAELVTKVTSQVKPRLEAEITDFVLDELRAEIKKARDEIISSTQDFVDKAKADLKTELPNMYQQSVNLAQVNLTEKFADLHVEASSKFDASLSDIADAAIQTAQADMGAGIMQSLEQGMQEFQQKMLAENQVLLEAQLEMVGQDALQALTEQLQSFQQQALVQHQSELSESLSALQKSMGEDAAKAMRDELIIIQEKIIRDHQAQLNETLDGYLQIKGENAERDLLQKLQDYQEKLRTNHQEQLAEEMTEALKSIAQRVEESTLEQIGVMHSQVGTIQQETFAKLREDFNTEKDTVFNVAADEIKTAFTAQMTEQSQEIRDQFLTMVNGDLPEVQAVLKESIESVLSNLVPEMEDRLRNQLTAELQQLLLKVKFVLPE
jgi:predicted DNA binding CopG/RHH family protein